MEGRLGQQRPPGSRMLHYSACTCNALAILEPEAEAACCLRRRTMSSDSAMRAMPRRLPYETRPLCPYSVLNSALPPLYLTSGFPRMRNFPAEPCGTTRGRGTCNYGQRGPETAGGRSRFHECIASQCVGPSRRFRLLASFVSPIRHQSTRPSPCPR
jgi:hypothetical protein